MRAKFKRIVRRRTNTRTAGALGRALGRIGPSGPKLKGLNQIVKRIVRGEAETKQVTWFNGPVVSDGTYAQANYVNQNSVISANASDILRLIPYVKQGTSDNQRIGETIRPVSLVVQGAVCLPTGAFNAPTGGAFADEYVVIFVLQHVTLKSYSALSANDFTQLLRTGENTTVGFGGRYWEAQLPVENAYYRVLAKRKLRLRSMAIKPAQGGDPPNNTWVAPPQTSYRGEYSINLTKHLPAVFRYPESSTATGANDPTNSSIFMCMGSYRGDCAVLNTVVMQQSYVSHLKYKDL